MPSKEIMIKRSDKREEKRAGYNPVNNACTQRPDKNFMSSFIH